MIARRVYGASPFNAPGEFVGLDFSPDSSRLLAVLPDDGGSTLLVSFDVESGAIAERRTLQGRWRVVHALPGGEVLLGWWGNICRLSAKGRKVWSLEGSQQYHLAALSPDRKVFVTLESKEARVHDVKRRAVLHTLRETDGDLYAVAFSADGSLLATGSSKGTVRVFDARTGKLRAKRGSTKVLALAFSPDGEHLLVGHGTGKVALWAVDGLKPVRPFAAEHSFGKGLGGAGCRWVGFSLDGARAFSLGNERRLCAWSVPDGDEAWARKVPDRHDQGSVTARSPDGRWIGTGSTSGALSVWSTEKGAPRTGAAAPAPILGLALTPRAVVASSTKVYASWERASGKRTDLPATFPPTDVKGLASGGVVRLDYHSVFLGETRREAFKLSNDGSGALALSRDETLLAAPVQEKVQVWEFQRGLLRAELPHVGPVTACAFGPSDAWLVTADAALHVWRLGRTPQKLREISLGNEGLDRYLLENYVRGLAVSPRGWLAVSVDGSDHNTDAESALWLVDPRSGETVSRLERPEVRLGQVAFVGDTRVAVADSLGRLLLADVSEPGKARWLEPALQATHAQSMKESRPIAVLGDTVAYVGPDGSVVVETVEGGTLDGGAPFLLNTEPAPRRPRSPGQRRADAVPVPGAAPDRRPRRAGGRQ